MDKLVTIKCKVMGSMFLDPMTDATFSLSASADSGDSGWFPVTEYVSSRAPLYTSELTSETLRNIFTGSATGTASDLDILVPSGTLRYRVNVNGSSMQSVSVTGSFSGSF